AAWRHIPHVGSIDRAGVRVEADAEGGDGLDCPMQSKPFAFASGDRRSPDQPAQSFEHPTVPQGRVAPHITALADQPVRVADLMDPEKIRLRHCYSSV